MAEVATPPAAVAPRLLTAADVRALVGMPDAIDAVGEALGLSARNEIEQPTRLVLGGGRVLVMAATHVGTGDTVVKTVSVILDGHGPAPSISGTVLWVDGATGQLVFSAEGGEVTALRTGAVSGLATSLLATEDARHLAIIGSGRQAAAQADAVLAVRPISSVTVTSRTPAHAEAFAQRLRERVPGLDVGVAADAESAVREADIVCCATAAIEPLFRTSSLRPDVHVNAIGSYRVGMAELPSDLLATAVHVVVDDVNGCLEESGEIVAALEHGMPTSALRPLAELVVNRPQTRGSGRTVFKSVGCAVLDWAIASRLASRSSDLQT